MSCIIEEAIHARLMHYYGEGGSQHGLSYGASLDVSHIIRYHYPSP